MTDDIFKKLLFSYRITCDDSAFISVVSKPRCDKCGQNGQCKLNLVTHVSECNNCGENIEHKYLRVDTNEVYEIVYNFDNWCQVCCARPLFEINYVEDCNDCVKCALNSIGYANWFVDKLCDKYYLPSLYNNHGISHIINLINNKIIMP